MDPLSDVLSLLKPQSVVSGGFGVNGQMSIQFPRHRGIKCYAVVSGQCWLSVDGVPDALLIKAGDCFLLPRGRPFCLATDLSLPRMDFQVLLAARRAGEAVFSDETAANFIVGGHFVLTGNHAEILLSALPPIVHIRKEADKAAMRRSLELMKKELDDPRPGSTLIAQQLAYVMVIQALRLHLTEEAAGGVGWLFALADKQIGTAITCMHEDPGHTWTLQELAERVGMSRSIFALRFKERVGATPMGYLTRWRMLVAGDRLKHSGDTISAIACSLGYDSESAFGKAFRRVMGCSPRQHGRGNGHGPDFFAVAEAGPEREVELAAAR